jgi:hypothetical protein
MGVTRMSVYNVTPPGFSSFLRFVFIIIPSLRDYIAQIGQGTMTT